jgi:aryl-alcohol dehydrogenase-like predicted oxidoreductase
VRCFFRKYPENADKVVLSIKGAYDHKSGPTGTAEGLRASVEEAVRVLEGTKQIDVFEMARSVFPSSSNAIHVVLTFRSQSRSEHSN